MPELPEVETIRRGLADRLIGDQIRSVDVRVAKMFVGSPDLILHTPITAVRRIAKVLIIDFANHQSLIIHLKMTGQLIYVHGKEVAVGGHPEKAYEKPLPHQYTHIIYHLKSGAVLYYNDLRKFGWHKVWPTAEIVTKLGPEFAGMDILSPTFTVDYFAGYLKLRPKRPVKELLMDQRHLAGLGNIYAAEALWQAKIKPDRQAQSLTKAEQTALYEAIKAVIKLSLIHGGSSFNSYRNAAGEQGSFLQYAAVYKKTTDPLGHPVERLKQAGRTTYFCPLCQR